MIKRDRIEAMVEEMSVEEKVGQLFMVGFEGTELSPELRSWIVARHVGGVILFRKNITGEQQLKDLTRSVQELARGSGQGVPLLIATDQELGRRSSMIHFAGIPPEPREVAAMDSVSIEELARKTARNLKGWGLNMNLAPVVDVDRAGGKTPLSYRTLADDPDTVGRIARILVRGFQEEGVIATAKHFPGLGDVKVDSHRDTPHTTKSVEELRARELVPYEAVIDEDVACIMTAHINVWSMDSVYPATLSEKVLTGFLRDSLGFEGVVITDAMQMGGVSKHYDVAEACVMALNAGADIILHCPFKKGMATSGQCYTRVLEAVKRGEISENRLDDAVCRVIRLKSAFGLVEE